MPTAPTPRVPTSLRGRLTALLIIPVIGLALVTVLVVAGAPTNLTIIAALVIVAGSLTIPLIAERLILNPLKQLDTYVQRIGKALPQAVVNPDTGRALLNDTDAKALSARTDEIGNVATTLTDATADIIRLATQEQVIRDGVDATLGNVGHRVQLQISKVLARLDQLGDEEQDPNRLAKIWEVDHLATQMRRHADNLMLLAGQDPLAVPADSPEPVVDIVRAAATEIEDYTRVNVRHSADASATVVPWAVNALQHLLTELLANAVAYSPPDTKVDVTFAAMPIGLTVQIVDAGLGMAPEALDEAKRRLTTDVILGATEASQLGLYVIGKLARRLGVSCTLTNHTSGRGLTATLVLTSQILQPTPVQPRAARRRADLHAVANQTTSPSPILAEPPAETDAPPAPNAPPATRPATPYVAAPPVVVDTLLDDLDDQPQPSMPAVNAETAPLPALPTRKPGTTAGSPSPAGLLSDGGTATPGGLLSDGGTNSDTTEIANALAELANFMKD